MPSRLHHLALMVEDLGPALRLFRDLLGLELAWHMPEVGGARLAELLGAPGFRAEMAYLEQPGGGVALELVRPLGPGAPGPTAQFGAAGSVSLSLMVADLDGLHQRLAEAGWPPLSPPLAMRAPGGQPLRAFCLLPLPGLCLELMEPADPGGGR